MATRLGLDAREIEAIRVGALLDPDWGLGLGEAAS
jgi:hypothetical protein